MRNVVAIGGKKRLVWYRSDFSATEAWKIVFMVRQLALENMQSQGLDIGFVGEQNRSLLGPNL